MTRTAPGLLAAVVLCLVPAVAVGQEPAENELEFVQKLRAKGYLDLAGEYLQTLEKRADPKLAAALPLEKARVLVAQAREKGPDQRAALFAQARTALEQFIAKNPDTPEAARATLEKARLSAYQGQALLTKALRQEDKTAAHAEARPAEALFQQAANDLAAATKVLQATIEKLDSDAQKAVKRQLEQDLSEARFDRGINVIDRARTYIDTGREDVNRKRAEIIEEAGKVFKELEGDDSTMVGLLANAWLMKVSMERQDPQATLKYHKRVMDRVGAPALPGQRWARLFYMQDLPTNPAHNKMKPPEKLAAVEKEGKAWLKEYPTHVKAPEGQGVLWELASNYVAQAQQVKDQKSKAAATLYDQAIKVYDQLAETDGDYSYKANQVALALRFQRLENKTDLRTFDDLFLKGSYEWYKAGQASSKLAGAKDADVAKLETEIRGHLRETTRALGQALALATPKTPVTKLDEAKQRQAWAYHLTGDYGRAAVAGEALGRTRPPTKYAGEGAAIALTSYAAVAGRDKDDAARARLRALAEYVLSPDGQKFWAGDRVTAVAHYELALLANAADDYQVAIGHLQKLTPDFPRYLYARGQLVFIATEAREKATDEKAKAAYRKIARDAADGLPPLPVDDPDLNPSVATMYFYARMELPKMLYAEAADALGADKADAAVKTYARMNEVLKDLQAKLEKLPVKLTPETRGKLDFSLDVLQKYADLGLADVEYRKGEYEKVIEATKKVVDRVTEAGKKAKEDEPLKFRDFQVTGDVLGLAMRAYVQKGNIETGKTLLNALQRLESTEGLDAVDSGEIVRKVLREIGKQVDDLRASKDPKDAERLKAMVGNFSTFLDTIAKDTQAVQAKKGLDPERLINLGNAYVSLDQPARAAEVYANVPAPAGLKKDKLDEKDEREVGNYWFLQVQRAKAMRLAKADPKATEKVLTDLLTHKHGRNQILADMEKNFLLEDQGLYGPAIVRWNAFLKNQNLVARVANDRDAQRFYFTGAFHRLKDFYLYSKDPKVKNRQPFVNQAVNGVLQIEHTPDGIGWGVIEPLVRDLVAAEPGFRAEYEKAKANRKAN